MEAEYLRFHCPERTGRLTQVLDYFHGVEESVADDHVIFRWEKSPDFGPGDAKLLSQVCLQMGFPMDPDELPFYLSGESRELGDNYPEMPVMRDIVFFFKALMTPTSESLPELRRWRPRDAALWWKYKPGMGFETHGFARRMEVHPWKEGDSGDKGTGWRSSMGGGFLASLFGGGDKRPRCPPSGGNPSNLAGKEVNSEEDVLHLQKLPTFDGLLRPSESELLLTYLTAPYLRVPLVLKHFADPQRVRALGHKDIQGVLDACFFEPGPWQPPGSVDVPQEVPAPSRAHMATPCGLLLHELSNAPAPLVDAAEEILAMTLELDTGRHDSPCAAGLLYAVRLMTRMHCFVRYALVESGLGAEVDGVDDELTVNSAQSGERLNEKTNVGPGGWAGGSGARGVRCPPAAAAPLLHAAHRLRRALDDRVLPCLRRWLHNAVRSGENRAACCIHAHLAYLHWCTPPRLITRRAAQTLLTAQAYILVNHRFVDAAEAGAGAKLRGKAADAGRVDESLGFAACEIFDLFQRQRRSVLTWMERNPAHADAVLEEVVRVLTLNSSGLDDYGDSDKENKGENRGGVSKKGGFSSGWFGAGKKKNDSNEEKPPVDDEAGKVESIGVKVESNADLRKVDRRWVRVPGPGGAGRFIPETEAVSAAAAAGVELTVRPADENSPQPSTPTGAAKEDAGSSVSSVGLTGAAAVSADARAAGMSYEDWMRSVTTMAVEMEINAQLGEFTVRKNRLKALQQSVREMPDFIAALGQTLLASHIEAKATRASKALAEVPVEENSGGENNGFRRTDGANAGRGEEAGAEGIDGGGGDSDNESDDDDGVDGVVVHCAEVKRTEHRLWMRLVGLRHDVQLWDKETRAPALPFNRPYKPLFTSADIAAGLAGAARGVADLAASVGAVGLAESERWISERLDPVVAGPAAGYLDGVELFLPVQTVKGPIAHLAGFAKLPAGVGQPGGPPSDAWGFEPGSNERFPGDPTAKTAKDAAADKKKDKDAAADKKETAGHSSHSLGALTEVIVLRDPPLVQVYRVESHGRRWRRALVFASSASWCLADVDPDGHPALEDPAERYLLSSTRLGAASSSLVISRHLTETQGRQQFVPARHLRGLMPAAILKEYAFWQDEVGDLHGDPVPGASHPRTVIHAKLVKGAGADVVGFGAGEHAAVIRRIPLRKDDDDVLGVRPGAKIPCGSRPGPTHLDRPALRPRRARRGRKERRGKYRDESRGGGVAIRRQVPRRGGGLGALSGVDERAGGPVAAFGIERRRRRRARVRRQGAQPRA